MLCPYETLEEQKMSFSRLWRVYPSWPLHMIWYQPQSSGYLEFRSLIKWAEQTTVEYNHDLVGIPKYQLYNHILDLLHRTLYVGDGKHVWFVLFNDALSQ